MTYFHSLQACFRMVGECATTPYGTNHDGRLLTMDFCFHWNIMHRLE